MSDKNAIGCGAKRARAGRPPDPAKDEAIIRAARERFFENGFNGTTIEEIAQLAGVSKVTIYKRYCDKETLFEACVREEVARMAARFDIGVGSTAGLEERLNGFGMALLAFVFRPKHVALDRILSQEFSMLPGLGLRMFEAGPAQSRSRLAQVVREACEEGVLTCADPIRAAEDLLGLWRGFLETELKFAVRESIDEETIRERVEHGTRTFLRAYRNGQ